MDHILFAGPWVKPPGCVTYRVVLHCYTVGGKPVEYVVHDQSQPGPNNSGGYDCGHYFPFHSYGEEALPQAMKRFWERCSATYHVNTPPYLTGLDEPDDQFLATLASDPNK